MTSGWAEAVSATLVTAIVLATVFASLRHADTVALRVGEPYGTLVLTIAVTTIEVSVVISIMLHAENNPTLAREAIFSTVIIVCAGVIGTCLTVGALRHSEQALQQQGTTAFLTVLIALSVLTLILPDHLGGGHQGNFSTGQLAFVSLTSVLLYGAFLVMQTGRYRAFFLDAATSARADPEEEIPTSRAAALSFLFLCTGLVAIVLLADDVAAGVEDGLVALALPQPDAITGALVATMVLLPEAISAIRAARGNRLQRSLNIALGSALSTIGLTVPTVALVCLLVGRDLTLGLENSDGVLLMLALLLCVVSFGTGRTNVLTGLVHLVVFATYLLLLFVP
jgi:Ca2+:H+ antiporter